MEIKKAYSHDFELIFPLLQDFNDQRMSKNDWSNLFRKQFKTDSDYFGFYLLEDSKAVGFIGLIFSERKIKDNIKKIANMTAWIVKPGFRQYSLHLIYSVLSIPDIILTNLTPNRNLWHILIKFGFSVVDNNFYLIFPLFCLNPFNQLELICSADEMKSYLNNEQLSLIDAHRNRNSKPYLFIKKDKKCLIFASRVYKKNLPFSQVLHTSDNKLFSDNINQISFAICTRQKSISLYVAEHFINRKVCFSKKIKAMTFFKGEGIAAEDIDFMYSEIS